MPILHNNAKYEDWVDTDLSYRNKSLVETLPPAEVRELVWQDALYNILPPKTKCIEGSFAITRLRQEGSDDKSFSDLAIHPYHGWTMNMKSELYQPFSEEEYYTLMAFAENLSAADFQDFAQYFWKKTVLILLWTVLPDWEHDWLDFLDVKVEPWTKILRGTVSVIACLIKAVHTDLKIGMVRTFTSVS